MDQQVAYPFSLQAAETLAADLGVPFDASLERIVPGLVAPPANFFYHTDSSGSLSGSSSASSSRSSSPVQREREGIPESPPALPSSPSSEAQITALSPEPHESSAATQSASSPSSETIPDKLEPALAPQESGIPGKAVPGLRFVTYPTLGHTVNDLEMMELGLWIQWCLPVL